MLIPPKSAPLTQPTPPTTSSSRNGIPRSIWKSISPAEPRNDPSRPPPKPAIPAASANTHSFVEIRLTPMVALAAGLSRRAISLRPKMPRRSQHDEQGEQAEDHRRRDQEVVGVVEVDPEERRACRVDDHPRRTPRVARRRVGRPPPRTPSTPSARYRPCRRRPAAPSAHRTARRRAPRRSDRAGCPGRTTSSTSPATSAIANAPTPTKVISASEICPAHPVSGISDSMMIDVRIASVMRRVSVTSNPPNFRSRSRRRRARPCRTRSRRTLDTRGTRYFGARRPELESGLRHREQRDEQDDRRDRGRRGAPTTVEVEEVDGERLDDDR